VAAQLAGHGGHGEGGEGGAEVGVEALDGLEHPEHRHLHEVVERLALVGEALGAVERQPAMLLDQVVAHSAVTLAPVPAEPLGLCLVVPGPRALRRPPGG
jgi:hypothetical protein